MKDKSSLKHIAIIMDGNGRWANGRSHIRSWGHIRGSYRISKIVEASENMGLDALTFYAFSSENWSRPFSEIKILFSLLRKFLLIEKRHILKHKIRFKLIGNIQNLTDSTRALIEDLEEQTRGFKGLKLTFAFGYGGRSEIIEAVNNFIEKSPNKRLIKEKDLNKRLSDAGVGDVDLLIRTGGDLRVSNFLLWQIAYAELFFTKTYWPDFKPKEFNSIIEEVSQRQRRFGYISESVGGLEETTRRAEKNRQSSNNALLEGDCHL